VKDFNRLLFRVRELELDGCADTRDAAIGNEVLEVAANWWVFSEIGKAHAEVIVHDLLQVHLRDQCFLLSMDEPRRVVEDGFKASQRP
jgi:hypothetical protein